jgi:hypothetical protein
MITLKTSLAGFAGAALAAAGIGFGVLTMGTAGAQPGVSTCTGNFGVQTLSANGSVQVAAEGKMAIEIGVGGDVKGTFEAADGSFANVFGQVNGRSIGLAFEGISDGYVFGTGVSKYDPRECRGVMGGPASSEFPGKLIGSGAWLFTGDNPE